MILSFADDTTADLYHGRDTKAARKIPKQIWNIAARKLDLLNGASRVEDLKIPPGNRLEKLSGDRVGQHSIRINNRWRICFRWVDGDAADVEIVDYH